MRLAMVCLTILKLMDRWSSM